METDKKYICKSQILERGWTQTMIKKFLGNADLEKTNPIYKCAAPLKLYLEERILAVEETDEFKAAVEKAKKRSAVMTAINDKKRDEILDYVENMHIDIPVMELTNLYKKACQSYNDFQAFKMERRGDYYDYLNAASLDSDEKFLNRISTNYLRHQCTQYEDELEKMFGKVGVHEAHDALQSKINDEILKTYPMLVY